MSGNTSDPKEPTNRTSKVRQAIYLLLLLACAVFLLFSMCNPVPISRLEVTSYFLPPIIGCAWQLLENRGAPKNRVSLDLIDNDIIAPTIILYCLTLLHAVPTINGIISELIDKTNETLLGLFVLFPWLGLVRALLAVQQYPWTKPVAKTHGTSSPANKTLPAVPDDRCAIPGCDGSSRFRRMVFWMLSVCICVLWRWPRKAGRPRG